MYMMLPRLLMLPFISTSGIPLCFSSSLSRLSFAFKIPLHPPHFNGGISRVPFSSLFLRMCFSTRYIPTRSFPQTTSFCPWSIDPTADWRCLLDYLISIRFSIDMKLLPMWVSSSSTSCLCSVIIFHFVGQARNLGRILDPFLLSSPYLSEAPGAIFFHPHHGLTFVPQYF